VNVIDFFCASIKKKGILNKIKKNLIQTLISCEVLPSNAGLTCILPDVIKGPQPSCCANA